MKNVLIFILICLLCPLARAEEVIVQGVPFITQSPPGDWQDNKNCGPTSALMIAGYYKEETPSEDKLKAVIDWLYAAHYIYPQKEAEYYDGNATTAAQMASVLDGYFSLGPVVKKNEKDMKFVKDKLAKGNPLMVAVNIDMDPSKSGHFMVLTGVKDDKVVVHDPGKSGGANNEYAQSQFMKSWATSNYASVFVDTSDVSWHPDGALVQVSGDPEIYLVAEGQTHWIVNEAVFKAHGFDWQKVIYISQNEFDCLSAGEPIDWKPYRELFRVGETYYLMEKGAFDEPNCSVYQFSSAFSFNSWNIVGEVTELDQTTAQAKYFASCADGGILFVRAGTLLKPTFAVPEYGAGVIFVASQNGVLLPFADWSTFVSMGYDKLPLTLMSANDFNAGFLSFGPLIDKAQSETCASGQGFVIGAFGEADNDADGVSAEAGDCDDADPLISPNEAEVCDYIDNNCNGLIDEGALNACGDCSDVLPEVCDGVDNDCDGSVDEGVLNACGGCGDVPPEVCDDVDNDCDGLIDEGELCGPGLVCAGICLETLEEPVPEEGGQGEEEPEPESDPPAADEPKQLVNGFEQIICSVKCSAGMNAYIWYADSGQVSGPTATMESTIDEICLRGQPWIDFNCACTMPEEWACFDPGAAVIECNHAFILEVPGVIDAKGEGEIWFTDFQCFP